MPWTLRVTEDEVAKAIAKAHSWRDALGALGYAYHGKNIATIRKWAARWNVSTAHLSDYRGQRGGPVRYSDDELRSAVAASLSWAETLRRLGYCPTGGNAKTLKRKVARLEIPVDHFDPYAATRGRRTNRRRPLDEVLVKDSTYSRSALKQRLYEAGLKQRICELCGQGETWNGRQISLIIDHINGVRDDNRLENLRIICPNCAAGLDTHCGRKNRADVTPRECLRCARRYMPNHPRQKYCSRFCGSRWERGPLRASTRRVVERPDHDTLSREVNELGYLAVGRKYGVSDTAVRKWLRRYERERAVAEGRDPSAIEIPVRTWPSRRRPSQSSSR